MQFFFINDSYWSSPHREQNHVYTLGGLPVFGEQPLAS